MAKNCEMEQSISAFEKISAKAGAFELKIRLACELSKNEKRLSIAGNLEEVINYLRERYNNALSSENWEKLHTARKIRNKLYHGELDKAYEFTGTNSRNVSVLKIGENSSFTSLIQDFLSGKGTPVTSTSIKKDFASVTGWLLECFSSEAFMRMEDIFRHSCQLSDKIADFINTENQNSTPSHPSTEAPQPA